jgi:hypothetical protein
MSSTSGFGTGVFGTSALGTQPFFDVKALIDAVLYASGHSNPATETQKRRAILQFINNRYQNVCLSQHWRWLKASYDYMFEAPYTTGTATAVQGDATVTGIGTVWSANLENKNLFFFNSSSTIYHIASVTNSLSLKLETEFAEDSVTTATAYTSVQNQYKVPKETDNILSIIVDSKYQMVPLGPIEFRRMTAQDPTRLGTPKYLSLIRRDTDDDAVYLEVWPAPDRKYQVHIDYTVRIARLDDSADCYPVVPDRYRSVLYYGALAEFYGYLRDPTNRQLAENDFKGMFLQMQNDTQLTDEQFRIIPARNYRRRAGLDLTRFRGTTNIEDFGKEG